jgi:hypothetical protein
VRNYFAKRVRSDQVVKYHGVPMGRRRLDHSRVLGIDHLVEHIDLLFMPRKGFQDSPVLELLSRQPERSFKTVLTQSWQMQSFFVIQNQYQGLHPPPLPGPLTESHTCCTTSAERRSPPATHIWQICTGLPLTRCVYFRRPASHHAACARAPTQVDPEMAPPLPIYLGRHPESSRRGRVAGVVGDSAGPSPPPHVPPLLAGSFA